MCDTVVAFGPEGIWLGKNSPRAGGGVARVPGGRAPFQSAREGLLAR